MGNKINFLFSFLFHVKRQKAEVDDFGKSKKMKKKIFSQATGNKKEVKLTHSFTHTHLELLYITPRRQCAMCVQVHMLVQWKPPFMNTHEYTCSVRIQLRPDIMNRLVHFGRRDIFYVNVQF